MAHQYADYMSYTKLPSIQHIAKTIRPTATETERELHRIDRGRPPFSYELSWRLARPLYSGEISKNAALSACNRIKIPLGARCNAEVVQIIWEDSQGADYFCRPLGGRLFPIRKDLAIPVKPRFYFVKDGTVYVYWLQPWKAFDLTTEQLGLLASVIKMTFMVDEFENADLYLLNTSSDDDSGERRPKVLGLNDLPLLSMPQLTDALTRFASAYDSYLLSRKSRSTSSSHRPDDDQFDLF